VQEDEMKVCRKCSKTKEIEKFSKDKRRKDGHGSYCKECDNIRNRERYDPEKAQIWAKKYAESGAFRTPEFREKNKVKCREYRRNNPEQASLHSLRWAQNNREKRKAYQKKWRKSNLKQKAANSYLQQRIKKGLMERGSVCEDCNNQGKMEAHHNDYAKPLEVNWLCRRCHMKRHRVS
jgi:hypothetical protein